MITGATQLLFHIGDPIAQARAPSLVNPQLEARGADAVIVPLHVASQGLGDALAGWRTIRNLRGGIVTMPHKIAAAGLVDEASAAVRLIGACNVIRRMPDGRLIGAMLDGDGMVAALKTSGARIDGARICLVGAGGVALGIAAALAEQGAAGLRLHNRSRDKAEALAQILARAYPGLAIEITGEPDPAGCDIAINATSLGMRPDDPLPVPVERLEAGTLAAEVVIRDLPTPFLAGAAARGCRTQPGLAMLEAQIGLMLDFILPETAGGQTPPPLETGGRK